MNEENQKNEPLRTHDSHILDVISISVIRYLEAMVGCYVRMEDTHNASKVKRIIREIRLIRHREKNSD